MADEKERAPKESATFQHGDQVLDAWGREVDEDSGSPDYSSWAGKELADEIERRNASRAEEDRIVLDDRKKATAVAALEADDKAQSEDDDEDDEE